MNIEPKGQSGRADYLQKGTEDAVSVTELQPGSDIEKKEQELQGQIDGPKSRQHLEDSGCPDCQTKKEWTRELEMRLMDQEEIARHYEEKARQHEDRVRQQEEVRQRDLADLSCRINELEAQQFDQASASENPVSQPLAPHYYCNDCSWTQRQLHDAKQRSRDLEGEVMRRKSTIRALEYEVHRARDECEVLRQRLDEADIEIARLRAQLGPRTSKL